MPTGTADKSNADVVRSLWLTCARQLYVLFSDSVVTWETSARYISAALLSPKVTGSRGVGFCWVKRPQNDLSDNTSKRKQLMGDLMNYLSKYLVKIITPRRSVALVAYILTFRVPSLFWLSVRPSVSNERVLWENGRSFQDVVSAGEWTGSDYMACTLALPGKYGWTIVQGGGDEWVCKYACGYCSVSVLGGIVKLLYRV